jgi:tricorn protease
VAPRNDEETVKTAAGNKDGNDEENKNDEKTEPKAVDIDFESINRRVVEIPVHVGNVGASISAVSGNVIFLRRPAAGAAPKEGPAGEVVMWDLKEREEKTIISGVDDYTLSDDGKKLIYQSKGQYGIVDVAEGQSVGDGAVQTTLQTWIDPREEWKQLFVEAWRIERDFFYDPGMHGLNWQSVRERYEAMLSHVVDRRDLNYLIGEMIAELNASHSYVGGGDQQRPETIPVGLLGCDFELDGEHDLYRIKTILRGGPWDVENRSPLDEPGVAVSEGDYLLAVNHQPVDVSRDPWAAFQGTAGDVVTLTVNDTPSSQGARTVTVKPLSSEARLRNLAWIEANRQTVYKATDGRVGYIYVPDTGTRGQSELVRQFNPQHRMDALIIDERFNSGGQFGDRFVELLNRPLYARAARRDLEPVRIPTISHVGPKVMLINQWAGSGGDAFPYSFRRAGVGPLIGKRTWGGLIGISGNPRLIDGGYITAPNLAIFSPDGEWLIEGYGVDPDIEVENEPHVWATGTDQQLQKAIQVLMQKLEENPPTLPDVPSYPDRSDGKYK